MKELHALLILAVLGLVMFVVKVTVADSPKPWAYSGPRITSLRSEVQRGVRLLIVWHVAWIAAAAGGIFVLQRIEHREFRLFVQAIPALVGLVNAVYLLIAFCYACRPRSHPAYRRLRRFGDVRHLEMQIDEEIADRDALELAEGRVLITDHWLIIGEWSDCRCFPLAHLAWVYLGIFEVHTVSMGQDRDSNPKRESRLEVGTVYGRKEGCPCHRWLARTIIRQLDERAPWIVTGWSELLEQDWKCARRRFLQAPVDVAEMARAAARVAADDSMEIDSIPMDQEDQGTVPMDGDDLATIPVQGHDPTASEGDRPACPSCGNALPPERVICVLCGYNTRTGQRITGIDAS